MIKNSRKLSFLSSKDHDEHLTLLGGQMLFYFHDSPPNVDPDYGETSV